jgi:hypothetical protein
VMFGAGAGCALAYGALTIGQIAHDTLTEPE